MGLRAQLIAPSLILLLLLAILVLEVPTAHAQPVHFLIKGNTEGVHVEILVESLRPAYEGEIYSLAFVLTNLTLDPRICDNVTLLPSPASTHVSHSFTFDVHAVESAGTSHLSADGTLEHSEIYIENEEEVFSYTEFVVTNMTFFESAYEVPIADFMGFIKHGTVGKEIKMYVVFRFDVVYRNGSRAILEVKNTEPISTTVIPSPMTLPMELILLFAGISILMIMCPLVIILVNGWRQKKLRERRLAHAS